MSRIETLISTMGSENIERYDDFRRNISTVAKEARKRSKKTQKELSSDMGTSQPYISRVESGDIIPSVKTLFVWMSKTGFDMSINIRKI